MVPISPSSMKEVPLLPHCGEGFFLQLREHGLRHRDGAAINLSLLRVWTAIEMVLQRLTTVLTRHFAVSGVRVGSTLDYGASSSF